MQTFQDVSQFFNKHGLTKPSPKESWRLLKETPVGVINGIPRFRGTAIATNGVLVAIELPDGSIVYGHYQWFLVDKPVAGATAAGRKQPQVDILDFIV